MSNNTSTVSTQKNINLNELISTFLRKWYIIVITVAVCFFATLIYTLFFTTPMYSSNAKLYIINKETLSINSSDVSVSTYLTKDFAAIINDRVIIDAVVEELDNKYNYSQVRSFLTVNTQENTRIIEIIATSPNAADSKKIVDSICTISQEKLVEIMGLDRVRIIRNGNLAAAPSSPNLSNNLILGVMFAIILSAGVIFVIYITDNKISSRNDVEKILELNVLATIPYHQGKSGK